MTIEELDNYLGLTYYIEALQEELASISTLNGIDYQKSSSKPMNSVAPPEVFVHKYIALCDSLNSQLNKALREKEIIEKWLENVDDDEIRAIVRWRYFLRKKWGWIADRLHYSFPVPKYRLVAYLERNNHD